MVSLIMRMRWNIRGSDQMPKIIVTSRYLKSGSRNRKQLYRYVKYIATREGSVAVTIKDEKAPATKKQQELILRQQRVV